MKKLLFIQLVLALSIFSLFAQESIDSSQQKNSTSNMVFVVVEEMPTFRGGDVNNFREWVQERVTYPKELRENKVEGKVFVMFVIEPDGSVSNAQVMRGVHPLLDEEAVKVIKSSPLWKPGLQREVPVRVRFSITVEYLLI